ncbi:hypothetical protein MAE02_47600 [Microvirga aerophila]|uniref:Uncharacterized protein n=1 Tax=Microvirga aerophila TaxID=670291 RepID=A0A512BYM7_9HYPH|nr:hypothetical protein MAE02_47600 [Microvirga aerophila]
MMETADIRLPIIQQMRPAKTWSDIAKAINAKTGSEEWTLQSVRRALKHFISKGLADPALMDDNRAPRFLPESQEEAISAVIDMIQSDPNLTIRAIGARLTAQGVPKRWGLPSGDLAQLIKSC